MHLYVFLLSLFLFTGCQQDKKHQTDHTSYKAVEAFPNLSFNRPVGLQYPGDGSNRLFVVEQKEGIISVFDNDSLTSDKTVFLDISDRIEGDGNEEGLLGLAFHPDYQTNGYFYVNYSASNPRRTVISRFEVSSDNPNRAVRETEQEILSYEQPYGNHNGGQLSFGPDGYLYIASGDGGSANDPQGNGQDRTTLLGAILRIDVNSRENGNNYAIPEDNPFVGNNEGFREEIYAYGLRNPWRFSFDAENGRLWAGDVGQGTYEEIDIIKKGGNYGWNIMEGSRCFEPENNCNKSELELPVWEYGRELGVSITGGFVYRGSTLLSLIGKYIYADYATGRIWSLDNSNSNDPINTQLIQVDFGVSSFGADQDNELYICGFDGKIYRLTQESGHLFL